MYHAGAFSFEIRAWDIGPEDTQEIADHFDLQKAKIRKSIKAHKGISVYRDGLLALPKSDDARDWLGLDLRRVSKVGTRLSTSQIVGYVSISASENPELTDTSNREGLAYCLEVSEFQEILKSIINMMENERDIDRSKIDRAKPIEDLFSDLDASKFVDQTSEMIKDGADVNDLLPVIKSYSANLGLAKKIIQERFTYYSRLATIGTVAQMIVHEIRNRATSVGAFLDLLKLRLGPFKDDVLQKYTRACDAIESLEKISDTFLPLASRSFRKRKNNSILEERINACLDMQHGEITRKKILCNVPDSKTRVAVDAGELDAIILNLISNATYWLGQVSYKRIISFTINYIPNKPRVRLTVNNNGPEIEEEDIEKIFWPGVTRKPGGIGMGLTVVSELVAEYEGKLGLKNSENGKGVSFFFDIPYLQN
ncbi:MAG: Sporulation kinase E [bacterium ADurb.Bin243]|nr:MAG: Sporulation kinase E [bacterium ADurb.Bin243]